MGQLDNLIITVKEGINIKRKILTLLESEKFDALFNQSNDKEKREICLLVLASRHTEVKEWMDNHPSIPISQLSHKQLLVLAKAHKIPNYSRLTTSELCEEVYKCQTKKSKT